MLLYILAKRSSVCVSFTWPLTGLGSLVMKRVAGNRCVSTNGTLPFDWLAGVMLPAGRKIYFGFVNGGHVGCWVIFVKVLGPNSIMDQRTWPPLCTYASIHQAVFQQVSLWYEKKFKGLKDFKDLICFLHYGAII